MRYATFIEFKEEQTKYIHANIHKYIERESE